MANEFVARRGLIAQNNSEITGSLSQGTGKATGTNSHAEGASTTAFGAFSHAEGIGTVAFGVYSHAEGFNTSGSGLYSHAEGRLTQAKGDGSHAEGIYSISSGSYSHAEGGSTISLGYYSHAEGAGTTATGDYSHAEGSSTNASGSYSHAEGDGTISIGNYSHAEGDTTQAIGDYSHAEGYETQAVGLYSHAEGWNTIASAQYQHVQGMYNITSSLQGAFILGNGTSTTGSNLILAANNFVDISGSLHVKPNTAATVDLLSANKEQILAVTTTGQDTSFQSNYEADATNNAILGLEYLSTGEVMVGGAFTTINGGNPQFIAQLNADGSYSNSFNTNLNTGASSDVHCILELATGAILVGGRFIAFDGNTRNRLFLLNSDGTEDTSFYGNLGSAFDEKVWALAQNSNQDIFVGGDFLSFDGNTKKRLVKLDSSGNEDAGFTGNLGTGFDAVVWTIAVQSDGKVLVGGDFTDLDGTTRNKLVRLNTNGTVDTTFYTNFDTSGGVNGGVRSIKVQSDGKIVVGGDFTSLNGNGREYLIRLNSDGTEDTTFYTNLTSLGNSFDDFIFTLDIQSDQKILVGGQYTTFNGNTRNRLVRLNTDGTEDTDFYTLLGGAFDGAVFTIATDSSGNIVVGGDFTGFDSTSATYLVKLSSTTNTAFKENVSINRAPDNNLINIKSRGDAYNIIDVVDTVDNRVFSLNSSGSLAQGAGTTATGLLSHAQGQATEALGQYSHAEGGFTIASGSYSHAEGGTTVARGNFSHAEGRQTLASGSYSHAEGDTTQAIGNYSHAEGWTTIASGSYSHAEGRDTVALGSYSHAEGRDSRANGNYSHAEGVSTANGPYSHAEGASTIAQGDYSHAEGAVSISVGLYSHAEGYYTTASAIYSHAEGSGSQAIGEVSHAEGDRTVASGSYSHAEGSRTIASGSYSHAEGDRTTASGSGAHAEGSRTIASGQFSHAEGQQVEALGQSSHAEGSSTLASGLASHAEGYQTVASGNYSHAAGLLTVASGSYQSVIGQYNISSSAQSAFIIGNGTATNARSNLIFASGSEVQITGSLNTAGTVRNCITGDPGAGTVTAEILSFASSPYGLVFRGYSTGVHSIQNQREANDAELFGLSLQPLGGNVSIGKTTSNATLDITGSTLITGSLRGQVSALSIASNTASINLASNNFFTVTLVNGANTHISASNIRPGQTVNVRVTQGSLGTGTMTFNSAIKSGSFYTGSAIANAEDIMTFVSFDTTTLYMSAVTNLK
jgi:uncharacterized delta-60 repeat protein